MNVNRLGPDSGSLRRLVSFITFSAMALNVLTIAEGADARANRKDVADEVRGILEQEAAGELDDRRSVLQSLSAEAAAAELAQWSMGNIAWEKRWVPFASVVEDEAYQSKLQAYRQTRDSAAERAHVEPMAMIHRRLANWCREQDLREQEWFHWTQAVHSDPTDGVAHAQLGDELIGDVWYTRNEIEAAKRKSDQINESLATWLPRLRQIMVAHSSSDPAKRATAAKRIKEFADADAVPAIQVALYGADGALTLQLVSLLAEIGTPDAAIVLTEVALAETHSDVGEAAIQKLRNLPKEYYVPALLGALSSPVTHEFAIVEGNNGQLLLQQALFRETQSHRSVQRMLKAFQFDSRQMTYHVESVFSMMLRDTTRVKRRDVRPRQPNQPLSPEERIALEAAQNKLQNEARLQKDQVDAANARTEELNRRIYHVLSLATEAQLQPNAQDWWQWWYAQNELYVPQEQKPTQYAYQVQNQVVPVLTYSSQGSVRQWSCLVAGTLVQTAEGQRPVETIQPGDLVLSQHPETGELAYKPVLYSTSRPPAPVVSIATEESEIRATGGHLFWVAGRGWVRARMLTEDMRLHDVHGTTPIQSVTADEKEERAYNLIVADFHTYFVGPERVLSYDNTPLRPTTVQVPGLATH